MFNLAAVASVIAAYPTTPLLIVEGEKDAMSAGDLGVLATTNADGAGKWRAEKDQLCIEFEKEPLPTCYDVWLAGKQVELRREGLLPLQGTLELSSGRN